VFVSYSHLDGAYVERLEQHLVEAGLKVWTDRGIEYGSRWRVTIEEQIEGYAAFLPVMSPRSRTSEWVRREILYAQEHHKPILPLLLEGTRFLELIDVQDEPVAGESLPSRRFIDRLRALTEVDLREPPTQSPSSATTKRQETTELALWEALEADRTEAELARAKADERASAEDSIWEALQADRAQAEREAATANATRIDGVNKAKADVVPKQPAHAPALDNTASESGAQEGTERRGDRRPERLRVVNETIVDGAVAEEVAPSVVLGETADAGVHAAEGAAARVTRRTEEGKQETDKRFADGQDVHSWEAEWRKGGVPPVRQEPVRSDSKPITPEELAAMRGAWSVWHEGDTADSEDSHRRAFPVVKPKLGVLKVGQTWRREPTAEIIQTPAIGRARAPRYGGLKSDHSEPDPLLNWEDDGGPSGP
jgi:hypothetical protein